jgi:hypothetical protein
VIGLSKRGYRKSSIRTRLSLRTTGKATYTDEDVVYGAKHYAMKGKAPEMIKANLDRIVERLAALPAIDRQQVMEALARPEPYKAVEEGLEKKLGMLAQVLR